MDERFVQKTGKKANVWEAGLQAMVSGKPQNEVQLEKSLHLTFTCTLELLSSTGDLMTQTGLMKDYSTAQ